MSAPNLFVFCHSPYQSQISLEGLDALYAFAAFEQPTKALFIGDGVLQLIKMQNPTHTRNIEKMLQALALYDIPTPSVCADSLKARGIDTNALAIASELLAPEAINTLMQNAKHCFSF